MTAERTGEELRDYGVDVVGIMSPVAGAWRSLAAHGIDVLVEAGEVFSADDLIDLVGLPPIPNQTGAAFLRAARAGQIEPVGYVKARRPSGHARVMRTWQRAS